MRVLHQARLFARDHQQDDVSVVFIMVVVRLAVRMQPKCYMLYDATKVLGMLRRIQIHDFSCRGVSFWLPV